MSDAAPGPGATGPTTSASPRRWRWVWIALVASLAVNLLLVGLIGGASWYRARHGWHPPSDGNIVRFVRRLPDERREAIRAAAREDLEALRGLRSQVRQLRRDVNAVLAVEPFDRARFEAALEAVTAAEMRLRRASNEIYAATAQMLTPQERSRLSAWNERWTGRREWRRGSRREDGQGE